MSRTDQIARALREMKQNAQPPLDAEIDRLRAEAAALKAALGEAERVLQVAPMSLFETEDDFADWEHWLEERSAALARIRVLREKSDG